MAHNYKISEFIDQGNFSEVYRACNITTNEIVAVKQIKFEKSGGVPYTAAREISILRELSHENVVRMSDVVFLKGYVWLVFEHVQTDLYKYMKSTKGEIRLDLVKEFLRQILLALRYCHSRGVLHRDIKPENLLVDTDTERLKVADFGLAKICGILARTPQVGSRPYRAPEILLGSETYFTGVDIWSAGCIFAEMLNNKTLFPGGSSETETLKLIFSVMGSPDEHDWPGWKSLPKFQHAFEGCQPQDLALKFSNLDAVGVDLLKGMLCLNPERRIDAKRALKHEYFSQHVNV